MIDRRAAARLPTTSQLLALLEDPEVWEYIADHAARVLTHIQDGTPTCSAMHRLRAVSQDISMLLHQQRATQARRDTLERGAS